MTQKNIFLSPITDSFLNEIVDKRKRESGLPVTKKGIVAELIFNAHKREIK